MGSHIRCWLLPAICVAVLVGCSGSDHPATVPVSGTITLNGTPVEGATVSFMTGGASLAAHGVTDIQGRYELSTFGENDGAVIGTHKVAITKSAVAAGADTMTAEDPSAGYEQAMMGGGGDAAGGGGAADAGGIPAKYSNPAESKLEAPVTQGGDNTFDFDLQ
jgi:hypothetical protein